MSDFWTKLTSASSQNSFSTGMDTHLAGNQDFEGLQKLTDNYREKRALVLPVESGTRVAFMGWLESFMAYDNPPSDGMVGEVVTAKSANGAVTSFEGKVFVKFDDGVLRSVYAQHLQLAGCEKLPNKKMQEQCEEAKEEGYVDKEANNKSAFVVTTMDDLSDFMRVANSTLVHKSTQDLWSFSKDADGNITVERLYDSESGEPIKL